MEPNTTRLRSGKSIQPSNMQLRCRRPTQDAHDTSPQQSAKNLMLSNDNVIVVFGKTLADCNRSRWTWPKQAFVTFYRAAARYQLSPSLSLTPEELCEVFEELGLAKQGHLLDDSTACFLGEKVVQSIDNLFRKGSKLGQACHDIGNGQVVWRSYTEDWLQQHWDGDCSEPKGKQSVPPRPMRSRTMVTTYHPKKDLERLLSNFVALFRAFKNQSIEGALDLRQKVAKEPPDAEQSRSAQAERFAKELSNATKSIVHEVERQVAQEVQPATHGTDQTLQPTTSLAVQIAEPVAMETKPTLQSNDFPPLRMSEPVLAKATLTNQSDDSQIAHAAQPGKIQAIPTAQQEKKQAQQESHQERGKPVANSTMPIEPDHLPPQHRFSFSSHWPFTRSAPAARTQDFSDEVDEVATLRKQTEELTQRLSAVQLQLEEQIRIRTQEYDEDAPAWQILDRLVSEEMVRRQKGGASRSTGRISMAEAVKGYKSAAIDLGDAVDRLFGFE